MFWGNGTIRPLYEPLGSLRGFAKIVHDATQAKQDVENLKSENLWLEALFDRMPVPVLVLAADSGHVLFRNRALISLLGQVDLGAPLGHQLGLAGQAGENPPWGLAAEEMRMRGREYRVKVGQEVRSLAVYAEKLDDVKGRPSVIVASLIDVTSARR